MFYTKPFKKFIIDKKQPNKYKSLLIILLFVMIILLVIQGINHVSDTQISSYMQPIMVNLSKDSLIRLLPEQKYLTIPPFQNLINQ